MWWPRARYPQDVGWSNPSVRSLVDGRDGQALSRDQRAGIYVVGRGQRVDDDARIGLRSELGRDRPQRVPGPHHIRPAGSAASAPPTPTALATGPDRTAAKPTATASAPTRLPEHVFDPWRHGSRTGVRYQEENRTYVCIPSWPVLPSRHREAPPKPIRNRRVCTVSDITSRQQRILDFIERTVRDRGYPPTVREIGEPSDSRRRPPSTRSSPTSNARGSSGRTEQAARDSLSDDRRAEGRRFR